MTPPSPLSDSTLPSKLRQESVEHRTTLNRRCGSIRSIRTLLGIPTGTLYPSSDGLKPNSDASDGLLVRSYSRSYSIVMAMASNLIAMASTLVVDP